MRQKLITLFDKFLAPILAFYVPFFLTFHNGDDRDLWYHLKSGEVFATQGLLHHDVFSFVTTGRELLPTEWLFQVSLYFYQHLFGLSSIGILVGMLSGIEILLIFLLLKKFTKVSSAFAILLSLFYFAIISNTFFPRPFGIANIFLMFWFLILWLYLKKKKNILFLLPFLMYLWANMHGSFIIGLCIGGAYAIACTTWGWLQKQAAHLKTGLTVAAWTVISAIVTVLPPLYLDAYKVLLLYARYKQNATYIIEWNPVDPVSGVIYTLLAIAVIAPTLMLLRKQKETLLLIVPILPLLLMPFLSQRHIIIAFIPIIFSLALLVHHIASSKLAKKIITLTLTGIALLIFAIGIPYFITYQQLFKAHNNELYPVQATAFIKKYHLKGNMFNGYNYGGYLLYHLYPDEKVFVDARADPYLCCEIGLLKSINDAQTDDERVKIMSTIIKGYNISYVLLTRAPSEGPLRKILDGMNNFQLIYWDDVAQVYVRKDSANTKLLQDFTPHFATPFGAVVYDTKNPQEAYQEYKRMTSIADSAKSRNAMGVIAISLKDIADATKQFQQAIRVNQTFLPPYINLTEIYTKQKRYTDAIQTLEQAIVNKPTISSPYLRLSQLYRAIGNIDQAKAVLQEGIDTVDDPQKEQLIQALQSF